MSYQKEYFTELIENNDIYNIESYFQIYKTDVNNSFKDILNYSKHSTNQKFISNFLNLFLENDTLIFIRKNTEIFKNFLNDLLQDNNDFLLKEIYRQNYQMPSNNIKKLYINKKILNKLINNEDKDRLKKYLSINHENLDNMLIYCLQRQPDIAFFLLDNFEWIREIKESQKEKILNHAVYKKWLVKNKFNKF